MSLPNLPRARWLRSAALVVLASCKASDGASSAPVTTELATPSPSPLSTNADHRVDDDVSLIDEDGRFEVDARVTAVTGKLVRVTERRLSRGTFVGWLPIAQAANPQATDPSAPKGYQLRIGSGRLSTTKWLPSTHVFPAPWAGAAHVKEGDTVRERRFGDFAPPTCVVVEVPQDAHQSVTVRCDGATSTRSIARRDLFRAFEPGTLAELTEGRTVYFDKMHWAMVVGKSGGRVVIRETGFGAKDKVVDVSRVQIVR